ncbi:LytR C-terminal domain-containing protein [Streptomyces sp. NBC_01304]|uniref:LytR C-terminal domain-containing protein n=1 Tax=Streptomyces sp. NBC_01304 TaxID=2903818 RepID=UPI002E0D8C1A|nr:LytR C-terminal domain-containing protein [Streptomyces sp. NBC_01304]
MSMLTPPGMGGEYRITGDKYPRMRRTRKRRRIVLALVASVAALGLVGWGTLQLIDVFSADEPGRTVAANKPDCKPGPAVTPKLLKPGQITVNVFNATPRSGLAKEVAAELKKRGFAVGKVDNANREFDKKVEGTGILLGSKGSAEGAFPVLGAQLAGAERQIDTRKKATEIDLILGKSFKDLTKKQDADKALAEAAKPVPAPKPKGC